MAQHDQTKNVPAIEFRNVSQSIDEKRVLDWPANFLRELDGAGHYGFPPGQTGTIPLMYSLRARKDP